METSVLSVAPESITNSPERSLYSGPRSISNVYWPGRSSSTTLPAKRKMILPERLPRCLDRPAPRIAQEQVGGDRLLRFRHPRPGSRIHPCVGHAAGSVPVAQAARSGPDDPQEPPDTAAARARIHEQPAYHRCRSRTRSPRLLIPFQSSSVRRPPIVPRFATRAMPAGRSRLRRHRARLRSSVELKLGLTVRSPASNLPACRLMRLCAR